MLGLCEGSEGLRGEDVQDREGVWGQGGRVVGELEPGDLWADAIWIIGVVIGVGGIAGEGDCGVGALEWGGSELE
ncbi:MAG: hypothetical protein RI897_3571 [Verrucomicrobiota bacterium]